MRCLILFISLLFPSVLNAQSAQAGSLEAFRIETKVDTLIPKLDRPGTELNGFKVEQIVSSDSAILTYMGKAAFWFEGSTEGLVDNQAFPARRITKEGAHTYKTVSGSSRTVPKLRAATKKEISVELERLKSAVTRIRSEQEKARDAWIKFKKAIGEKKITVQGLDGKSILRAAKIARMPTNILSMKKRLNPDGHILFTSREGFKALTRDELHRLTTRKYINRIIERVESVEKETGITYSQAWFANKQWEDKEKKRRKDASSDSNVIQRGT